MNLWIAIAAEGHVYHTVAKRWFDQTEAPIFFCRFTQAGFLRLVTQQKVMGSDALQPKQAWECYFALHSDSRIRFDVEPDGIQQRWEEFSSSTGASDWTDSYLAAFAIERGHTFVTFDKGFRRFPSLDLTLLEA